MSAESEKQLRDILPRFAIRGILHRTQLLKRGHIHDTWISEWIDPANNQNSKFLHQRLNQHVFPNIPLLLENIAKVVAHLQTKVAGRAQQASLTKEKVLALVLNRDGALYVQDPGGDFWRTYEFIENTISFDVCPSVTHAQEAARIFGQFIQDMADFPAQGLHEIIPFFQDGAKRIVRLQEIAKKDLVGRRAEVERELEFVNIHAHTVSLLSDSLQKGILPLRVTHADPKINNVLFDARSAEAVAVVDLDTCMQGTALYDFGDLLRSGVLRVSEDETDLGKVDIDLNLCEALVRGFLGGIGKILQKSELHLMAFAPRSVSLALGCRFLTDYLEGDVYFKISDPQQNLRRAKVQFKLAQEFENIQEQIQAMVGEL